MTNAKITKGDWVRISLCHYINNGVAKCVAVDGEDIVADFGDNGTVRVPAAYAVRLYTEPELFKMVAKANGLRGRQAIVGWWSDCADEWVFDSNAKGGYGETMTFHYATTADLLRDIAPDMGGIAKIGNRLFEFKPAA